MKKVILIIAVLLPLFILSCSKEEEIKMVEKNYVFKNQDPESIKTREIINRKKFRSNKNGRTINSLNFGINPSGFQYTQYNGYPTYNSSAYAANYNNYSVTLQISGQASSLVNISGTGYYQPNSSTIVWTIPANTTRFLGFGMNFNWVEAAERIEQIAPTFVPYNWSGDVVYVIRSL